MHVYSDIDPKGERHANGHTFLMILKPTAEKPALKTPAKAPAKAPAKK